MTTSSITGSNPYSSLLANSTASASASAATGSVSSGTSAANSQDLAQTFLTLLVAQMNNQDPLNPVDNSQLTTQMAQISTVTGINNLNGSVTSLLSQLQQSATIQSAQLSGHSVMVAGSTLTLATGTSSSGSSTNGAVGGYNLSGAAKSVTVTITDSSGATVRTLQLGAQGAGFQDFTWDGSTDSGGTAAPGNYQFAVSAVSSAGAPVTSTAYNLQTVVGSVPQADGSTQLMLNNGSTVAYTAVKQII
jgi:flagellar basal-body rod modification protein FlgD